MKKKTKISLLVIGIFILICGTIYSVIPRFDIETSNKMIKAAKREVKDKDDEKIVDESYVAKISVKGKMSDVYVFDNASEETLFNKGAGIQEDISTKFEKTDYTYVKGHVETTFKNLDKLVIGDIIKVELENGKILKYKVSNIHEGKYLDNNEIYTYTNKVGLSISTCSKNSINKQFPEKVLVVDSILID